MRTALSIGSKSRSPSPDPQPGPSRQVAQNVVTETISTPFTDFLANELKHEYHKLVAMSFAVYIKDDTEAEIIDLDDITHFLGYKNEQKAVKLLLKILPETTPVPADAGDEIEFTRSGKNRAGRKKTQYLISFDQFEELLLAAQTAEGTVARKALLAVKKAVFKFIKQEQAEAHQRLEMQAAHFNVEMVKHTAEMKAVAEADKALLIKQLEDMRLTRFWLYAFKLGARRYKIGYAANVDERERQHQTTCPSGRNVHVVRVNTKYTEKLLDSVLKKHLNHVRGEEYEIEEGDRVVTTILNTIARVDEAVHTLPYDQFENLLEHVAAALRGDKLVKSKNGRVAEELLRPYRAYVSNHLVVTSDPLDRLSYADIVKGCRCSNDVPPIMTTASRSIPLI